MSTKQILLGFLPWIAFSLIATRVGPGAAGMAALLALVLAAVLVGRTVARRESVKLIEVTGLATFAVIGAWAVVAPSSDAFLANYGRGLAALVLAVVIALSLAATPFTEQYARESVPRQYWDSPQFHAVNRRISAAWAGAVAAMGVGHLISGVIASTTTEYGGYLAARPADLILNWLVPGALILLTVRYTRRVVGETESAPATR
ncbi:hypothetical protein GCM10009836_39040 [Pseudonocardia ailaonensis]|uniref:DUF3159 domain-containing protein n=1 Tax=Pseudonocardia ailaonensis TaxID=367279 RepID=A0ABN2N7H3_9PSEU